MSLDKPHSCAILNFKESKPVSVLVVPIDHITVYTVSNCIHRCAVHGVTPLITAVKGKLEFHCVLLAGRDNQAHYHIC